MWSALIYCLPAVGRGANLNDFVGSTCLPAGRNANATNYYP